MIGTGAVSRAILIGACAFSLSGCISLLPKSKPAQLYRFGNAVAPSTDAASAAKIGISRGRGNFDRASSGDRILTVEGEQIAYIAEARWVSPAAVLFDEALARSFGEAAGPARLLSRGESGRADYVLNFDVQDFETVYENGPGAAPIVVVRMAVNLTRMRDRSLVAQDIFQARVSTSDNRVSAITAGYDKAVAETLGKLVTWVNRAVAPS